MSDLFEYASAAENLADAVEGYLFYDRVGGDLEHEAVLRLAWQAYVEAYDKIFESSFVEKTFTLRRR